MFFIISKVLSFIIHPFIWVIGGLIIALLTKNSKSSRLWLTISIIIAFLFSNNFLFNIASNAWEVEVINPTEIKEQYDIAVILGGMASLNKKKDLMEFSGNSDRFLNILPLYFDGRIKKILIAGGSGRLDQDEVESDILATYLVKIGVNKKDIILETKSRNTYENAKFSSKIIRKDFPNSKVLLSTSATHMRRSLACFRKQAIEPFPFSVDKSNNLDETQISHFIIPDASILDKWYWLIHEWIGLLTYTLRGYC